MENTNQNIQFAHIIPRHSISVYGETVGHSYVTEKALDTLSFDVTHKLYEILRECKTQMNVYRQCTLSTTVMNNVFERLGTPNFYGNKILIPYMNVPHSDMSVLNLTEVDLQEQAACDTINIEVEPVPFIKGLYVTPISTTCNVSNLMRLSSVSCKNDGGIVKSEPMDELFCDESSHVPRLNENTDGLEQLSQGGVLPTVNHLESDYFIIVAQIILRSSDSLFKGVVDDLRSNPRLGSVNIALLNFVANSIKHFDCVGKLIDRLLRTVEALLDNPYIDASYSFSVDEAVNALCSIVLEPNIAYDSDDFTYRRRASYLLMRAHNTWTVSVESKHRMLNMLKMTLTSPEKMSLKLNYSVLVMFHCLGYDILDCYFWPTLGNYLNVLCSLDEIISGKRSASLTSDICRVKNALLLIAGILYRNFWVLDEHVQRLHLSADALLEDYFGDTLHPVRIYAVSKALSSLPSRRGCLKNADVSIDKDYRSFQFNSFRKKSHPVNPSKLRERNSYKVAIHEAFDSSSRVFRNPTITFNFIGSNQRDIRQLRRKRLDNRFNLQWNGQPSRKFLKCERGTRCIKYCTTKRSLSGDISTFI